MALFLNTILSFPNLILVIILSKFSSSFSRGLVQNLGQCWGYGCSQLVIQCWFPPHLIQGFDGIRFKINQSGGMVVVKLGHDYDPGLTDWFPPQLMGWGRVSSVVASVKVKNSRCSFTFPYSSFGWVGREKKGRELTDDLDLNIFILIPILWVLMWLRKSH